MSECKHHNCKEPFLSDGGELWECKDCGYTWHREFAAPPPEPFIWFDGEVLVSNEEVKINKLDKYSFMRPLYTHPAPPSELIETFEAKNRRLTDDLEAMDMDSKTLWDEIAALKAENEKLRKDGERYRYLRNKAATSFVWDWESECGIIKDANIDAALDKAE